MTSKREMPGCVVVTPAGEYDLVTREPLDVQIRELQGAGCAVVLDLGDTSFVDAGFVRLLDGAYRRARASGLGFAIVMPAAAGDEVARMLLDLLPLGAEFPIAHTLDRALALAAGSDEPPVAGSLRASTLAARAQAARRVAWRESARTRSLARERDQLVADVRDTVARCRRTAATRAG